MLKFGRFFTVLGSQVSLIIQTLWKHPCRNHPRRYAATLTIIGSLFASQAEAQLINFDLTDTLPPDSYGTGIGVFGTASSQWNLFNRSNSAVNLNLFDDTGAATSVTVSYTRLASSSSIIPLTGTFQNLGRSEVFTSGNFTLSGLTAGGAYQLAIFSAWNGAPSFSVGSTTKTISTTSNWSTLNEGFQYVLFQTIADSLGQIQFTANSNPTGTAGVSFWSAFQLQDVPAAASVPEPSYAALMMAGLGAWLSKRRTARLA